MINGKDTNPKDAVGTKNGFPQFVARLQADEMFVPGENGRIRTRKHFKTIVRGRIKKYKCKLRCFIFPGGMHQLRRRIRRRDHHTCQLCSRYVGDGEIHHIRPRVTHPHLVYSLDNCVLLCHECHKFADKMNTLLNRYHRTGWFPLDAGV